MQSSTARAAATGLRLLERPVIYSLIDVARLWTDAVNSAEEQLRDHSDVFPFAFGPRQGEDRRHEISRSAVKASAGIEELKNYLLNKELPFIYRVDRHSLEPSCGFPKPAVDVERTDGRANNRYIGSHHPGNAKTRREGSGNAAGGETAAAAGAAPSITAAAAAERAQPQATRVTCLESSSGSVQPQPHLAGDLSPELRCSSVITSSGVSCSSESHTLLSSSAASKETSGEPSGGRHVRASLSSADVTVRACPSLRDVSASVPPSLGRHAVTLGGRDRALRQLAEGGGSLPDLLHFLARERERERRIKGEGEGDKEEGHVTEHALSLHAYHSLIIACGNGVQLAEARRLVRHMERHGVRPTEQTLNLLAHMHFAHGERGVPGSLPAGERGCGVDCN